MIRFSHTRTVTGAAHHNWSIFGSRGPCLAPEDDGGGSAAPAPLPSGDSTAAPAPAPAEIAFTPEQQAVINKLVGQARQEGRNAATKAPSAPVVAPQPAAPAPEQKMTIESLAATLAETQLRARFDKRAAKRGIDDDAADDLFELYKAHKPTDDENWFTEREKRLGLKQVLVPPQQPSTPTTASVPVVPSAAPISDRGSPAPNGATGWKYEIVTNPMSMSAGSRSAMDAELGVEKARKQRLDAARAQAERLQVVINPRG